QVAAILRARSELAVKNELAAFPADAKLIMNTSMPYCAPSVKGAQGQAYSCERRYAVLAGRPSPAFRAWSVAARAWDLLSRNLTCCIAVDRSYAAADRNIRRGCHLTGQGSENRHRNKSSRDSRLRLPRRLILRALAAWRESLQLAICARLAGLFQPN